jgi:FkbM family methyltransferase
VAERSVTAGPGGTKLRVESTPGRDSFWDRVDSGSWEPETFDAMHQIVSPGDRVIDVGAWIGPTALYAASLGGDVVAYEPDPKAVAEMRTNLELNTGFSVSVRAVGLGTESGTAVLKSRSLGDSMSSLVREAGSATDAVEVQCRAIEHEAGIEHFAGARLVKVDIEGYEFQLLPKLMRTLRNGRFDGDLLLSTHAYPTFEKTIERVAGSRLVASCVLPALMFRQNVRLLWSIRGATSAHVSRGGSWQRFSLKRRIWFVIHPRGQELWLTWRVS